MTETFLGIIIVALIGIAFVEIRKRKNFNYFSWERFAQSNRLKFSHSGSSYSDSYVEGDYQNCHFDLSALADRTFIQTYANNPINITSVPQIKEILPRAVVLEEVDRLFKNINSIQLKGVIGVEENGQSLHYEQIGIEDDENYLELLLNLFCDLINIYPQVMVLGAEIVPYLTKYFVGQENSLHYLEPIAIQWLKNIGEETRKRLGCETLQGVCPSCLLRFSATTVSISAMNSVEYFCCRACGQSQEILRYEEKIIAILDTQTESKTSIRNGMLRINWCNHRGLFDFDQVKIIRAEDEGVERFAVQVGNDTDILRQPHYKQMVCEISPDCELSENTLRILRKTFGKVAIIE